MKNGTLMAIIVVLGISVLVPFAQASEDDPPGEMADIVYYDCDYGLKDATGTWWKDWLAVLFYNWVQHPGHAGLYVGYSLDHSNKALIHCDNPYYYYDNDRLRYPLPNFAFYETRALYGEQVTAFTTPPDGTDYRGSKTTNPRPSPPQRVSIVSYALEKHDLPITYWAFEETASFTAKGAYKTPDYSKLSANEYSDEQAYLDDNIWLTDSYNAWSCVGFVERCYEQTGLNPTPNDDELLTPILSGGRSIFVVPHQYNSANMQWSEALHPKIVSAAYSTTRNTDIVVTFSPDNFNSTTFPGNISVVGSSSGSHHLMSLSWNPATYRLTIEPTDSFSYGENVTVTLSTGIKDMSNNGLDGDSDGDEGPNYTFSFNIESNPGSDPTAIDVSVDLSPLSVEGGASVSVSGTARYNSNPTRDLPVGTAIITVDGDQYTDSVLNGSYSTTINAPNNQGSYSVNVSVYDDEGLGLSGSHSETLTVIEDDPIGCDVSWVKHAGDYWEDGDGDIHLVDERDYFSPTESGGLRSVLRVHNLNTQVRARVKMHKPDGTYWENTWDTWTEDWWDYAWWPYGWSDIPQLSQSGEYNVRWYIQPEGGSFSFVGSRNFIYRYKFIRNLMCENVDLGSYEPINPKNVFSPTEATAYTWQEFEGLSEDISLRWEWYDPVGVKRVTYDADPLSTVHNGGSFDPPYDWYNIWGDMTIAGTDRAYMCGNWSVVVKIKDPWGVWREQYTDHFRIEEKTAPSVSVSCSPSAPIETQNITLSANASDNNHLQNIVLHWNDGSDHTQTSDGINSGSGSISKNIGSFSAGQIVTYWAETWDESGNRAESVHKSFTVGAIEVTTPTRPSGDQHLQSGESATYSTGGSTENLGGDVEYQFDWGDGTTSAWGGTSVSKSWSSDGTYLVKARARSADHTTSISEWSSDLEVIVDSVAPVVTVTSNGGQDIVTTNSQVVLQGTALDPVTSSGMSNVWINSSEPNAGTLSDWQFTVGLNDGANTFVISAIDNAGNVGTDSITITKQVILIETPIHYVNINNSTPASPYYNWATAATNIQSAVDEAEAGDKVLIADGHYLLSSEIVVDKDIRIESVNGSDVTVVDGGGSNRCFNIGYDAHCTLSGLTITNGNPPSSTGGGVRCNDLVPVLTNCVIVGNIVTDSAGGGVYLGRAYDCTISYNSANLGGGVYAGTAYNCKIYSNSASYGGGMYKGTAYNCTIYSNSAALYGGGAYNATLSNSIISANSAQFGGGMRFGAAYDCTINSNSASTAGGGAHDATVSNSILRENSAINGGGTCSGTAYNCLVSSNLATHYGGGVFTTTLRNCTISANSAQRGGGMYYGTAYNCTISSNSATVLGGGGYMNEIYNSIISRNSPADLHGHTAFNSCSPYLQQGVNGNITNAPMFVDANAGDYHLMLNSPCINWGNNAYTNGLFDLDGSNRVVEGYVDIGCYEYQGILGLSDSDGDGLPDDWEHQYFGGNADPNRDDDGDGQNNTDEHISGMIPTDSTSFFAITNFDTSAGFELEWTCNTGRYYSVYWTEDLTIAFEPLRVNFEHPNNWYTHVDQSSSPQGFYKVLAALAPEPVTTARLHIVGPSVAPKGRSTQYTCYAIYNDGSSNGVTSLVNWGDSSPTASIVNGSLYMDDTWGGDSIDIWATALEGEVEYSAYKEVSVVPYISNASIQGTSSVVANSTAQYTWLVEYYDGSSETSSGGTWWLTDSTYANISSGGLLSALEVAEEQVVEVNGSAVFGIHEWIDTMEVSIIPPPGDEYEIDDSFISATPINSSISHTHSIHVPTDQDYYEITLEGAEYFDFGVDISSTGDMIFHAFDQFQNPMIDYSGQGDWMDIPAGVYYLMMEENGNDQEVENYIIDIFINPKGYGW